MKKINLLVEQYNVQQKKHATKKVTKIDKLRLLQKQVKEFLKHLRLYIRNNKFIDDNDEIHFFKNIKPHILITNRNPKNWV